MVENFNVSWIGLTYNCNNRCSWCYSGSNTITSRKFLEKRRIEPILDLLKGLKIKRTILIGGEPTIYPYLSEVLEGHKLRKIPTGIVTNGRRLANPDFCEFLKKEGVDSLTVSIQGYDSETHDKATNVKGSYIETMSGIREANRKGIHVSTNSVITRENHTQLEKIIDSLMEEPIFSTSFNVCGPCLTDEENNDYLLNPFSAAKSFERTYSYAKFRGMKIRLVTPLPLCFFGREIREEFKKERIVTGGPCQLAHGRNFVVDYNGDILPCTHMASFPLFNIFKGENTMSSEEFARHYNGGIPLSFRKKMQRNASEKCDGGICLEPCSGGCPLIWSVFDPKKEIKGIFD